MHCKVSISLWKIESKTKENINKMTIQLLTFNHVVFHTGYTSRLTKKSQARMKKFISEEQDLYSPCVPLFIYDSNETYHLEPTRKKEVNDIIEALHKHMEHVDGIIGFQCSDWGLAISLITCLKELEYCEMFGLSSLDGVELIEHEAQKILVITLDCESG
jgi:hypothetical protein